MVITEALQQLCISFGFGVTRQMCALYVHSPFGCSERDALAVLSGLIEDPSVATAFWRLFCPLLRVTLFPDGSMTWRWRPEVPMATVVMFISRVSPADVARRWLDNTRDQQEAVRALMLPPEDGSLPFTKGMLSQER
jgi:hypothetical protein